MNPTTDQIATIRILIQDVEASFLSDEQITSMFALGNADVWATAAFCLDVLATNQSYLTLRREIAGYRTEKRALSEIQALAARYRKNARVSAPVVAGRLLAPHPP